MSQKRKDRWIKKAHSMCKKSVCWDYAYDYSFIERLAAALRRVDRAAFNRGMKYGIIEGKVDQLHKKRLSLTRSQTGGR